MRLLFILLSSLAFSVLRNFFLPFSFLLPFLVFFFCEWREDVICHSNFDLASSFGFLLGFAGREVSYNF